MPWSKFSPHLPNFYSSSSSVFVMGCASSSPVAVAPMANSSQPTEKAGATRDPQQANEAPGPADTAASAEFLSPTEAAEKENSGVKEEKENVPVEPAVVPVEAAKAEESKEFTESAEFPKVDEAPKAENAEKAEEEKSSVADEKKQEKPVEPVAAVEVAAAEPPAPDASEAPAVPAQPEAPAAAPEEIPAAAAPEVETPAIVAEVVAEAIPEAAPAKPTESSPAESAAVESPAEPAKPVEAQEEKKAEAKEEKKPEAKAAEPEIPAVAAAVVETPAEPAAAPAEVPSSEQPAVAEVEKSSEAPKEEKKEEEKSPANPEIPAAAEEKAAEPAHHHVAVVRAEESSPVPVREVEPVVEREVEATANEAPVASPPQLPLSSMLATEQQESPASPVALLSPLSDTFPESRLTRDDEAAEGGKEEKKAEEAKEKPTPSKSTADVLTVERVSDSSEFPDLTAESRQVEPLKAIPEVDSAAPTPRAVNSGLVAREESTAPAEPLLAPINEVPVVATITEVPVALPVSEPESRFQSSFTDAEKSLLSSEPCAWASYDFVVSHSRDVFSHYSDGKDYLSPGQLKEFCQDLLKQYENDYQKKNSSHSPAEGKKGEKEGKSGKEEEISSWKEFSTAALLPGNTREECQEKIYEIFKSVMIQAKEEGRKDSPPSSKSRSQSSRSGTRSPELSDFAGPGGLGVSRRAFQQKFNPTFQQIFPPLK